MNKLISMNNHLRIGLLLTLFFISFLLLFITGNGFFIILGFVFLGILIFTNIKYSDNYSKIVEKPFKDILNKNDFNADDSYLGDDYLSGIAINESLQQIAITTRRTTKEEFTLKKINFKDIVESSIVENGETVIKSSKKSLAGGALIGGALAGGVGAIIGGVNGNKYSQDKVSKITLYIVVNDLNDPIHEVNFLNSNILFDRNSNVYRKFYHDANKWHKIISIILNRNKLNNMSV